MPHFETRWYDVKREERQDYIFQPFACDYYLLVLLRGTKGIPVLFSNDNNAFTKDFNLMLTFTLAKKETRGRYEEISQMIGIWKSL